MFSEVSIEALNEKIMLDAVPRDLPFIKRQGHEAATREYKSVEDTRLGIPKSITVWHKKNYRNLYTHGTIPSVKARVATSLQQPIVTI